MHALQIPYKMLRDSNPFSNELSAVPLFWVEFSSILVGFCFRPEMLLEPFKGSRQLALWNQFVARCLSDLPTHAGVRWAC